MPWVRIRRDAIPVALLAIVAMMLFPLQTAIAEEGEDTPTLADLLDESRSFAEREMYPDALRTIITAFETHPDEEWKPNEYKWAVGNLAHWFTQIPKSQRQLLLAQYESDDSEEGGPGSPLLEGLSSWLRELIPPTSLRSPGGWLALAGWNFLEGSKLRCTGYAVGILETRPDSLATEYVIQGLMAINYYRRDKPGCISTVRVAARLAPDNPAAAWALCQGVFYLCSQKRVDEAKLLIAELQNSAPNALVSTVGAQLKDLIAEIETGAYPAVFDRLWGLRDYAVPGLAIHILDTLGMGIEWKRRRSDPMVRQRIDALLTAALDESAQHPDSQRRGCALLVVGHIHQRMGLRKQAGNYFLLAAATREPGAEEYGLRMAGRNLSECDPKRAIAALERFKARYSRSTGASVPLLGLARLYRQVGRYEEAMDLCDELEHLSSAGKELLDVRGPSLTNIRIGCLDGLGRRAEADALARPILLRYGYELPMEQNDRKKIGALYAILKEMGRDQEASRFEKEFRQRIQAGE